MKKGYAILLCLLLSSGIWLIHNLTRSNSEIVSVSVLAESNLEGRAQKAADAVAVSARLKASGFRLLWLSGKRKPVAVFFDASDFEYREGDTYAVPSSKLYRYSTELFGPNVEVEQFLSQEALFRFSGENCKKVPVVPVHLLDFAPEYAALSEMTLSPDSVLVYGDPGRLASIESIFTATVRGSEIDRNFHGEALLEAPSGVRLSDKIVSFSQLVTRFVEIRTELGVMVNGAPRDRDISIYPSRVNVVFRCVYPLKEDPIGKVSCRIDYADFQNSLNGKCLVKLNRLPAGVLSYDITPQVCECIENVRQ